MSQQILVLSDISTVLTFPGEMLHTQLVMGGLTELGRQDKTLTPEWQKYGFESNFKAQCFPSNED